MITRSRQPPARYGHSHKDKTDDEHCENTLGGGAETDSNQAESSEYNNLAPSSSQSHTLSEHNQDSLPRTPQSSTPAPPSLHEPSPQTASISREAISIEDMQELIRSHEEDIVDQVFLRLSSQNNRPTPTPPRLPTIRATLSPREPEPNTTRARIGDLAKQLAQLQVEQELSQASRHVGREPSTCNHTPPLAGLGIESTSATAESVEAIFPGVERSTLTQIIENRF